MMVGMLNLLFFIFVGGIVNYFFVLIGLFILMMNLNKLLVGLLVVLLFR